MKILIVVDMQKDFIDGSLGTKEAVAIVPNVVEKIKNFNGIIIATRDTHEANYLETSEGARLPVVHCVKDTNGWQINENVLDALHENKGFKYIIDKPTFGSLELAENVKAIIKGHDIDEIELIGLCTDICVISNALLLKANFYETPIFVDSTCCAGVTPTSHDEALRTMNMCQINIK